MTLPDDIFKQLLIAYLAIGRSRYSDEQLEHLHKSILPQYLRLASEAIPLATLADRSLINQALDSLIAGNSVEETVMFSFMLYIYTLVKSGKIHPLELGVIRQKVNSLIPVFTKGVTQECIRRDIFEANLALLQAICEQTEDAIDAINVLAQGYAKYASY